MKTYYSFPIAATVCMLTSIAYTQAFAQTTVSYTSPIADYKPFVDEKVTSWKAANDKVGQIGGWRAYAKEAQQPENTPTPANPPTSKKIDPHTGHKP